MPPYKKTNVQNRKARKEKKDRRQAEAGKFDHKTINRTNAHLLQLESPEKHGDRLWAGIRKWVG